MCQLLPPAKEKHLPVSKKEQAAFVGHCVFHMMDLVLVCHCDSKWILIKRLIYKCEDCALRDCPTLGYLLLSTPWRHVETWHRCSWVNTLGSASEVHRLCIEERFGSECIDFQKKEDPIHDLSFLL